MTCPESLSSTAESHRQTAGRRRTCPQHGRTGFAPPDIWSLPRPVAVAQDPANRALQSCFLAGLQGLVLRDLEGDSPDKRERKGTCFRPGSRKCCAECAGPMRRPSIRELSSKYPSPGVRTTGGTTPLRRTPQDVIRQAFTAEFTKNSKSSVR